VAAFLWLAEPRRAPSSSARAVDAAVAVAATLAAVWAALDRGGEGSIIVRAVPGQLAVHEIAGTDTVTTGTLLLVMLTTLPLAFRRRYPATAFSVILIAVLATSGYVTLITFLAVVFAAYSAVVYSRFRRIALLTVSCWALVVTAAFPDTSPPVPSRFAALLVLTATAAVAVAIRGWQRRLGDSAERLRRAEAEHEAEKRLAVEAERARIAGELHDVVTHSVSVMVVQAGAARRVLDSSPGEAREALLAVESSGRTAMTELRHLLGLLAPSGSGEAALLPQPDLGQVRSLVERVRCAGLPVELTVTGARPLPPGVGLAAYRVVQEALTNVLKHAGQPRTAVRIEYLPRELLISVANDGSPARWQAAGGRGLIGLRERIGVYRGELDAGPRPGGGWRVTARIPLEDSVAEPNPPLPAAAT
jgi:signal transduction histidine kinase